MIGFIRDKWEIANNPNIGGMLFPKKSLDLVDKKGNAFFQKNLRSCRQKITNKREDLKVKSNRS